MPERVVGSIHSAGPAKVGQQFFELGFDHGKGHGCALAVGNTAQDQECEQGLVHGTLAVSGEAAQVLEFVDRLGGGHGVRIRRVARP